ALDLYEEHGPMWNRGQNFIECRYHGSGPDCSLPASRIEAAQLLQRGVGNFQVNPGGPSGCFVVHADDPAIGGKAEIGLDSISSMFPGQTEGFKRVFRGFTRSAAMPDYKGEVVRRSGQHN